MIAHWPILLAFAFAGSTATAQQAPRSAIPWLTTVLSETPAPVTATEADANAAITTTTLDNRSRDGAGILSSEQSGLPADLWIRSEAARVEELLAETRYGGPPALRALFRRVLLAQFDPPTPNDPSRDLLLTRIDRLLDIGALGQAAAMIDNVGADTDALFGRWFDISLLTDNADEACGALAHSPMLSPAKNVQIFCLVRNGDWDAAAVSLTLAETLEQLSETDSQLLAFFLDPSLIEEETPPPPRVPMSALEFLIRESVGLPRTGGILPSAFLQADLADYVPLRFRMHAAERLVRLGALDASVLFAAYREETPASSGGIWERAAAVQAMDAAGLDMTGTELDKLDREMSLAGLRVAAAREFGDLLSALDPVDLDADAHPIVAAYLLLDGKPDAAAAWIDDTSPDPIRSAAVIAGLDLTLPPNLSASGFAVVAPFLEPDPSRIMTLESANLLAAGRVGEVILGAADLLVQSDRPDPGDVTAALAALRAAGQDQAARDTAQQMLLLDWKPRAN